MKTLNKPLMRVAISELIQQHAFDHLLDHDQARFRRVFNQWIATDNDPRLNEELSDYLSKANLFVENMSPAVIQQWIYAMSCNNIKIAMGDVLEENYGYEVA